MIPDTEVKKLLKKLMKTINVIEIRSEILDFCKDQSIDLYDDYEDDYEEEIVDYD